MPLTKILEPWWQCSVPRAYQNISFSDGAGKYYELIPISDTWI